MANTLTQLATLSTTKLAKGVALTLINESPFISRMPYITVSGNAYAYNMQVSASSPGWYEINEVITESVPVWAQRTVTLEIFINDADLSKYIQQTRSNEQDIEAAIMMLVAEDFKDKFEETAIFGRTTSTASTKEMKGLMLQLAEAETATATLATDWDVSDNAQLVDQGFVTNGSAQNINSTLSLTAMDALIDAVKPGRPDVLITGRRTRRKLNVLMRATGGGVLPTELDQFGKHVELYDGIPLIICDHVPENIDDAASGDTTLTSYIKSQAVAATNDGSVCFALKWGERGICGVQNGGIVVEPLGTLETKDSTRNRIKWYVSMTNFAQKSIAGLINYCPTD